MTAPVLRVGTERGATLARVTLVGELDLDGGPPLRAALAACLARRPALLVLDLRHLRFCDCAGLNLLLEARISAHRLGVDLRAEGVGGQPARLLTLVGAEDAFAPARQHLPPRIA
jgi:anti-anti-sigma factor